MKENILWHKIYKQVSCALYYIYSQYLFINLTLLQLQKILFDGTDTNGKV